MADVQRVATKAKLPGSKNAKQSLTLAHHPEIEVRRADFEALLDRLTKQYKINDREGLGRVVNTAIFIYHGHSPLPKDDAKQLLSFIPKVTKVLFCPDNDLRIAYLLTDRDGAAIYNKAWDPLQTGKIIAAVWQSRTFLADLERVLQQTRPPSKTANMKLLRMVKKLKLYAVENNVRSTMKFVVDIVQFIDSSAVKRIPSAMKLRLKRSGQNRG
jgi:hypothetical protein